MRPLRLVFASVSSLLAALGCTPILDTAPGNESLRCELPADCGAGRTCGSTHGAFVCCEAGKRCCARDQDCLDAYVCDTASAACREDCANDDDTRCQAGYHCYAGDQTCRPDSNGSPCDVDIECLSGRCAPSARAGLTTCQDTLGRASTCQRDADCASGLCSNGVCCGAGQVCCNESRQCPNGYACNTNTSVCYRDCNTDNDSLCQAGGHCYAGIAPNRCQTAADGQRCDVDTECASNFCRKSDDRCVTPQKVVAPTPRFESGFGKSLAAGAGRLAVGFTFPARTFDRGSAMVFRGAAGRWGEAQSISARDGQANDYFGWSVSLWGNQLLVGAPQSDPGGGATGGGKVYFFESDAAGVWTQQQVLTASAGVGQRFGWSLAVHGRVLAVGRPGPVQAITDAGAVHFYERDELGNWVSSGALSGQPDDALGTSVATNGISVVAGAPKNRQSARYPGVALVYDRRGTSRWYLEQTLRSEDRADVGDFGQAVAIDGDRIVVGAPVMTVLDVERVGAAYIFDKDAAGVFRQVQKLTPRDPAPGQQFGRALAVSGDFILIGAPYDSTGLSSAGAAYLYGRGPDGRFRELQKVRQPKPNLSANFGYGVSLSGPRFWVAAPFADALPEQQAGAVYSF